jgi:hypothetical protein
MGDPIEVYFTGEKQGAAACLALGAVALGFSLWAWRSDGAFRAVAIPVVLIGLLQLGIGVGLFLRTDKQVATLRADLLAQPADARAKELARMDRVNASFTVIEYVEAALIITSVALALAMRSRPTVMAIGMGVLVQASVMLVFDLFAEHRAHIYTAWLRGT